MKAREWKVKGEGVYALPVWKPVLATALLLTVESESMESHGCMVIGKHLQVEVIEFKGRWKLPMNLWHERAQEIHPSFVRKAIMKRERERERE